MLIIIAQRIDYESDYNDVPFKEYHYPKIYRNQINKGDIFIYYQGDRRKKENRYYYGCGVVGDITISEDREHYFAKIENGIKFLNSVPIYHPEGGFFESLGYEEIRQKTNPPWQRAIRKLSSKAFKEIITSSGLEYQSIMELFHSHNDIDITSEDKKLISEVTERVKEQEVEYLIEKATDEEILEYLSQLNGLGSIEIKQSFQKIRKASRKVTENLKELYNYSCQICEQIIRKSTE